MSVAQASCVRYSHSIGRSTQVGPGFNNPVDLAAAPGGRLYVLNRSNMAHALMLSILRVTVCTIDEEYIGQFTSFGTGDGELIWPSAIAVDQEVNVYVSDERRHDVQMFDSDGNFLRRWGSMGAGPGQFNRPSGLATDAEGNLLVVDCSTIESSDSTRAARFLQIWGEAGPAPASSTFPGASPSIVMSRIYVADWRNGRVQQLDADGNHLASFGDRDGAGRLERPAGVGVDSLGNLYVSDYGKDVVQVYQADGHHLTTLVGDGSMTRWAAQYVAADPEIARCASSTPPRSRSRSASSKARWVSRSTIRTASSSPTAASIAFRSINVPNRTWRPRAPGPSTPFRELERLKTGSPVALDRSTIAFGRSGSAWREVEANHDS